MDSNEGKGQYSIMRYDVSIFSFINNSISYVMFGCRKHLVLLKVRLTLF
jgi:hypothetical protein